MTEFEKLKEKYDKLIKKSLDKNKEIIIESFVLYYGEEYRNIIEKRYNEITFVYYIRWSTIDFVISDFIPTLYKVGKYIDFVNFRNSYKDDKEDENKISDNLVGITNNSILNEEEIVNYLKAALNKVNPSCWSYGNEKSINRIVTFQILTLNENTIIHEINHALTRDELAYVMRDNSTIGPVEKIGLCIDGYHNNNGETYIEELLNEKASEEITKIFKSKGGDFSSFCFDIPLVYPYKYNFYLIEEFYKQFKEYIKIARISENKNELVLRVGKYEYEEFVKLVNECYTKDIPKISTIKEKVLPRIKKLIKLMKHNVKKSLSYSKSMDIEQLKHRGYKIRILDDEYSDEENMNIQR